jgi:hypothetical protein
MNYKETINGMNLTNILLSERSQTLGTKKCALSESVDQEYK